MYKITGYLHSGYINSEGETVQPYKTLYAKYNFTLKLKTLYLQLFYDSVIVKLLEEA